MLIYIPTYGRPKRQITFNSLPRRFQKRTIFVVRPEEEQEVLRLWGGSCRGVLVQRGSGVSSARQTALEHDDGFDTLCFLDDDLRFSARVSNWDFENNNRALKMSAYELEAALLFLQAEVEKGTACAGLGARGGNNGIRRRWINPNYRIMRSFALRRDVLQRHNIRFDLFSYFEDFHVALSLLELGYPNVVSVNWVSDGITNSVGGVQRDYTQLWQNAERFVGLHPTAKIVEKSFKHGAKSDVRKMFPDLSIQWKKTLGIKKVK